MIFFKNMKVLIISFILLFILYDFFCFLNKEELGTTYAFYDGNLKLNSMPLKDNEEHLVFDYGECDNGASIVWNDDDWSFLVKKLNKSQTKCRLYFRKNTLIDYILSKDSDDDLAYDNTIDNNLRFIGNTPKNYILFNCDSDGNNCEKWRIIGVFNNIEDASGNNRTLIKIIRDETIGSMSWDTSSIDVNNGNGVNEWSQADVQIVLNNDYLYRKNLGNKCYYSGSNMEASCPKWDNIGIKDDARKKIVKVKWNTGTFDSGIGMDKWFVEDCYNAERSLNVGKICSNVVDANGKYTCNDNVKRNTSWTGYVGLMYPSDYGYAIGGTNRDICLKLSMHSYNEDCYNNDWMFTGKDQWTMTTCPHFSFAYTLITPNWKGDVHYFYAFYSNSIRPVMFLNSTIKIEDDSNSNYGSADNPYRIINN